MTRLQILARQADGEGLRASQTISGATSYPVWDVSGSMPLLLNGGSNNFVYGPGGLPIEQISNGGTVSYLHHDQAGSTRLLTRSTGTVTAAAPRSRAPIADANPPARSVGGASTS
jgi:hypothetical protein